MEDINLDEVSLVDHPAHMVEGFAVIKAANPETNRALFSALRKETMPNEEKSLADVLKDATAEQIREALTEEQLNELAPVAKAEVAEPTEEDIIKSLPESLRNLIEKANERAEAAEAEVRKAEEKAAKEEADRLDLEAVTKSKTEYTNLGFDHDKVAPALRKFASADPEAAEAIETMLAAVNKQADGAIFDELGTSQVAKSDTEKTAADEIVEIAKARAAKENISYDAAFIATVTDPENAELVAKHFTPKENN